MSLNGDKCLSLIKLEQVSRCVKVLEGANASFVIMALSTVEKAEAGEITRIIAEGTAGKVLIHGSPLRHRLKELRNQGIVKINKSKRRKHYYLTEDGLKLADALKALTESLQHVKC